MRIKRTMPYSERTLKSNNATCKLPQKQYSLKIDKMFNFKTVRDGNPPPGRSYAPT